MQPWNNSSMSFAVLSLHLIRLNKKIDYFSYPMVLWFLTLENSFLQFRTNEYRVRQHKIALFENVMNDLKKTANAIWFVQ